MPETEKRLDCPSCRVIDAADGVEDGNLFASLDDRVQSENDLVQNFKRAQDRLADFITRMAGSMLFLYLHAIWFIVWIVMNVGWLGPRLRFDPYPYGLLTMIVSLEAIFLSTFVMISQNRQAARSEIRAQLDFETNLRGEIWAVHIGAALGLDAEHVEKAVSSAIAGSRAHLHAHDHPKG